MQRTVVGGSWYRRRPLQAPCLPSAVLNGSFARCCHTEAQLRTSTSANPFTYSYSLCVVPFACFTSCSSGCFDLLSPDVSFECRPSLQLCRQVLLIYRNSLNEALDANELAGSINSSSFGKLNYELVLE